jgi:hypothetical protein
MVPYRGEEGTSMARKARPKDDIPWIPVVVRIVPGVYEVYSEHEQNRRYAVNMNTLVCTCPAHMLHHIARCKHMEAVAAVERRERDNDGHV